MDQLATELLLLAPELTVFGGAILLLLVGLYGGAKLASFIPSAAAILLLTAAYVVTLTPSGETYTLMNGLLRIDGFTQFGKALVLLGSLLTIVLTHSWAQTVGERQFEFTVLTLLATLGMLLIVSADNLISVYMAFELMSLSLYILAAFRRDSLVSSEAGIKYFVLGSLASGILLFGMSLVYGFTGTTAFDGIGEVLANPRFADPSLWLATDIGILIGMVMIVIGLCFKISAVPFHMWTPDVYQGAPTPVTAFFAMAPKVAALALFTRLLYEPFGGWLAQWQQIVIFVSVGSMLVGAFAALVQTNIKRLLAYSSIGHVGYALIGVAAGTQAGVSSVLIYLAIYVVMTAGTFACVLMMRDTDGYVEDINQLAGLSKRRPGLAFALAALMFSLAGIPPLAGFFSKLYVFYAAMEAGLFGLAVIGVLSSVVGAYYYLRLVKLMYFDDPQTEFVTDNAVSLRYLLALCIGVVTLFFLYPAPLVVAAKQAASALWQ